MNFNLYDRNFATIEQTESTEINRTVNKDNAVSFDLTEQERDRAIKEEKRIEMRLDKEIKERKEENARHDQEIEYEEIIIVPDGVVSADEYVSTVEIKSGTDFTANINIPITTENGTMFFSFFFNNTQLPGFLKFMMRKPYSVYVPKAYKLKGKTITAKSTMKNFPWIS